MDKLAIHPFCTIVGQINELFAISSSFGFLQKKQSKQKGSVSVPCAHVINSYYKLLRVIATFLREETLPVMAVISTSYGGKKDLLLPVMAVISTSYGGESLFENR